MLQLTDLSTGFLRSRHKIVVSSCLNGTMRTGELVCMIGRNGTGKSTLLKTIAGLLPSLGGNILWKGKSLRDVSLKEKAKLCSIVLTNRIHSDMLTVKDTVAMGRIPYTNALGNLSAKDLEAVESSMEKAGVSFMPERSIGELSDGEYQRVMIAKALAQSTPLILLDEPTAYLDFPGKVAIMRLLRNLAHETNRSVLLSTHDLELAFRFSDCLWILSKEEMSVGQISDAAMLDKISTTFAGGGICFDKSSAKFSFNL